MRVQQDFDGSWSVWDGEVMVAGDLRSHAAAWAEVDRRTTRSRGRSASVQFRDLGSFDRGKVTPWTHPHQRRRGNNRKHKHGRSQ
jgi:hypothetical protein